VLVSKYLAHFYKKQFNRQRDLSVSFDSDRQRLEREVEHLRSQYGMELEIGHTENRQSREALTKDIKEWDRERVRFIRENKELQARLEELQEQAVVDEEEMLEKAKQVKNLQLQIESLPDVKGRELNDEFGKFLVDSFKGDYLSFSCKPSILAIFFRLGDSKVLFADYVQKVSSNNQSQKRAIALTNSSVVLASYPTKHGLLLKRRIPLREVASITLSRFASDLLVLHHKDKDVALRIPKRTEFVYHLLRAYEIEVGKPLKYHLAENLYVADDICSSRDISVVDTEKIKFRSSQLIA